MKCVICHGTEIQFRDVKEELIIGNDIIYVPLKIPVCQSCGERYYDRRTMQNMENIENRLKQTYSDLKEVGKVLLYQGRIA